mmetsp:Transcript_12688/g.27485  ORF Transcript_12688/g.27485 Transcript_12688/m.27485 type:complete len:295 (-) Transcript_12688:866-1750(-)|eukprot:CAMPEP_0202894558 /NCGR_PEP_ID=MMETSP1392-20130828/3941_1 /ASSEMBLY_ACC=CAM_ASM_000868 /TAXON_ID=225041 /ORGANISM="Chlamydomonas chlamydogama, Strain SAG 11-48b" /LENGTH=294 /DNA_ID=CAMNT_0049579291 /DNA_START=87 /DNA_END=971 /DNA_ORIENTATION=-
MAPTWQPTSGGTGLTDDELRIGTQRPSMRTNPLLSKGELGKVKKSTFASAGPDHVFGHHQRRDPEGAREVTMMWKEHQPSPGREARPDGKPLPDFKTMNKLAVKSGVTTAKDTPTFRHTNLVTVKKADHTSKAGPSLPSDRNAKHTYGMPSAHRNAEVVRTFGPEEPPMKYLVQGAYQDEWVRSNMAKADGTGKHGYIPPVPTRAAVGHAIGAQKYLRSDHAHEEWKMSKFKTVPSKVTQYFGSGGAGTYEEGASYKASYMGGDSEQQPSSYEPQAEPADVQQSRESPQKFIIM